MSASGSPMPMPDCGNASPFPDVQCQLEAGHEGSHRAGWLTWPCEEFEHAGAAGRPALRYWRRDLSPAERHEAFLSLPEAEQEPFWADLLAHIERGGL
jgi:hypothetical protein